MILKDAQQRANRLRIIAIPPSLIALMLLCFGVGNFFLFWPLGKYPLSDIIFRPILSFTEFFYLNTRFVSILWEIAPIPSFEPLNSPGNYYMLFLSCVIAIAGLMLKNAKHLSGRIQSARARAEEQGWISQMDGQSGGVMTVKDIMSLEINLGPKDKWHTRPMGVVVLMVTAGVLIQMANLLLGLV